MAQAYGAGYDPHRYESAADIAKRMRADIKAAVAAGELPAAPKYSVRIDNYSGGRSINITVQDWPTAWQDCDGYAPGGRLPEGVTSGAVDLCRNQFCAARLELLQENRAGAESHRVLTADARAALEVLEAIHRAYNYDRSDSMTDYFDVNYYGSVSFESHWQSSLRAEEKAKRDARRAVIDTAAAAGATKRVVVYGSGGRKRTVHDATELENGSVRLVCGAVLRRHSLIGDGSGRELSCSMCAKRAAKAAAPDPATAQRPPMRAYEVARGNPRFPGVRASTLRMSLDTGDAGRAIGALMAGATHYRPAGAGDWLEV